MYIVVTEDFIVLKTLKKYLIALRIFLKNLVILRTITVFDLHDVSRLKTQHKREIIL